MAASPPRSLGHAVTIGVRPAVPAAVDAGAALTVRLFVACRSGCDLRGRIVRLVAPDGAVTVHELTGHVDGSTVTDEICVHTPHAAGVSTWGLVFPGHAAGRVTHDAAAVAMDVDVRPHDTSVVVWDVPSPVPVGTPFTVKVGVRCATLCRLTGHAVEVRADGVTVGRGTLGALPWPDTRGLHWAEVPVVAPATPGLAHWAGIFTGVNATPDHRASQAPFTFRVEPPPAHRVTLTVTVRDTGAPLGGADVRVGVYRAVTDAAGQADVPVPAGSYDVVVETDGFAGHLPGLDVHGDVSVTVAAVRTPTEAEEHEALERYEASQWG